MAPSTTPNSISKAASRARLTVTPGTSRAGRYRAMQEERRLVQGLGTPRNLRIEDDPKRLDAPTAVVPAPPVPPVLPLVGAAGAPPAAHAGPDPDPALHAGPGNAPAVWEGGMTQEEYRAEKRANNIMFVTMAIHRDQWNSLQTANKVNPIVATGNKCNRAHDIMDAVVDAPKTKDGLTTALGYTKAGTYYQANPVKQLKNQGYLAYDIDEHQYFVQAHYVLNKDD